MKKIVYLFCFIFIGLTLFSCKKEINEQEVEASKMADIQENAVEVLDNQLSSGNNLSIAINNTVQQLMQNPEVVSACLQDSDQIVIDYLSGAVGVIYLFISDEEQNAEKKVLKTTQSSTETFDFISKEDNGEPLITNHKVLIWEPFENDQFWNIDCFPLANDLKEKFNNCPDINFDVTVKKNDHCTVQSIRDLTNYGFVFIITHGNCIKAADGETISYLFTRQEYTNLTTNNEDLKKRREMLITCAEIIPRELQTHFTVRSKRTYWAITNRYFSKYVTGTFNSPSIVYVTACKSYINTKLKDVFVNEKNASVYLGFTDEVSKKFGQEVALQFVDNMLINKLNAYNAYIRLDRQDPYKPKKAWLLGCFKENPTYYGQENYIECPARNMRWVLNTKDYYPDQWGVESALRFRGDADVLLWFTLSKMDVMIEGTYSPFIIYDMSDADDWDEHYYPMRFVASPNGIGSPSDISFSDDELFWIVDGQLIYQKQNGRNKYTFNFTADDGYSYYGEYTE